MVRTPAQAQPSPWALCSVVGIPSGRGLARPSFQKGAQRSHLRSCSHVWRGVCGACGSWQSLGFSALEWTLHPLLNLPSTGHRVWLGGFISPIMKPTGCLSFRLSPGATQQPLRRLACIVAASLVGALPASDPVKIFFILRCWQGNFS